MKLKKCPNCKLYSIKEKCKGCQTETKDAHYKFLKLRDQPSE